MRTTCPRCGKQIEADFGTPSSRISCSACGSGFSAGDLERVSRLCADLQVIGQYKIAHYLGSGAFTDVWAARHHDTDREVAIKVFRKTNSDRETFFRREAQATSQLTHPNIVKVYEFGHEDGRFYTVCDLVQGPSLDIWLRKHRPTPKEAAQICASLADTIHHAHEAGIVHRDLKPSNILMDGDGRPFITDFGLAKCESDDKLMSVERYQQALYLMSAPRDKRKEGRLLGTIAYMSPEQAKGDGYRADRRSDVYALGVILYELLTGVRPFRGATRYVLRKILTGQPVRPGKLKSGIPRDLETICLKAMSKDPSKRYATSQALGEDCVRAHEGKPILATPPSRLDRTWEWLMAKRLLLS